MRAELGFTLAKGAACGLIATGTLGLLFPHALSKAFGLTVREPAGVAFVRAAAARDAAIGAMILHGALRRRRKPLIIAAAACAALSNADLVNAYVTGGRVARPEHALHLAGASVFIAILLALAP